MEFIHEALPTSVVFGSGSITRTRDELARLGIERAFLLARRRARIGDWPVGTFDGAAAHVPIDVAQEGLDRAAAIATERPYGNPRAVTQDSIRALLDDAFHGRRLRPS